MDFDENGRVIVPEVEVYKEDNLIFKCNWNDAGWKGICSKEARDFNVAKHHSWCCDKRNHCSEMIEKNEKGFPCMESRLFVDFIMGAGSYLKGDKGLTKENKHIRGAQKGKLAFLTAVSPNTKEEGRYFIGILDIEEIRDENTIKGNKKTSIVISPKIKLKFWDYFNNKDGSKKWSSGRFRYVNDKLVLAVLEDLKREYDKLENFEKEKSNINMFIERYKKYV